MRVFLGLLFALTFVSASVAADPRWTTAYAQGTVENIIRNERGSNLNIYCPSGQSETTLGMFIEFDKLKPKSGEQVDVQIVVDGKSHPFGFAEIQFEAKGPANRNLLAALIDALTKSRARTFAVAIPKFGISERFSLSGAGKVFKSAKDFLDGCE